MYVLLFDVHRVHCESGVACDTAGVVGDLLIYRIFLFDLNYINSVYILPYQYRCHISLSEHRKETKCPLDAQAPKTTRNQSYHLSADIPMRVGLLSFTAHLALLFLLLSRALAIPTSDDIFDDDYADEDLTSTGNHHRKHCKRLSTVTYRDNWGPLFVESIYKCDLPLLKSPPSSQSTPPPSPEQEPLHPHTEGRLPSQLHQIISYGCAPFPSPSPLSQAKSSTLLYALPLLTNQSCLPSSHLAEYRDVKRPWSARWSLTNYNRGEETICDWYTELAKIASALHQYCEHSLERGPVGGGGIRKIIRGRGVRKGEGRGGALGIRRGEVVFGGGEKDEEEGKGEERWEEEL
ncbi:hypothetical protein BDZ91DRAFT_736094 [Kalaharituber pfeilii]|nr:hypothetical protein BDZ91DRAFT_736094 [Kalaharituber pfeilii]